ncbi:UNVERIFIED_CONTAM: putative inactive ATP-dependent zinc metalloprotease FTSHI 5, chloroplastic [Sesamum latifolium]|uniref:Inactive ATP-dependent zinc metalloprotease FTSHI 5, chloroplastic n=1 Tax=Sesamum latifolium TaxID=2727402 RepID=A0AAW2WZ41_9LAMI
MDALHCRASEFFTCASQGVLIVGERGTGKTSLALAIAAEARVPVVEVKAQQLEAGLWVGQSASNFIHTKKQDHEAFINQLLVELDGFEKQDGVVLMATTRSLKQIDEALRRPGRMDRIFQLQQPTQAEREKILRLAAKETMDEDLIDFVDWRKVAEKTALLRAIELKCVPLSLEGSAFRRKFVDRDELMSYCSWFAGIGCTKITKTTNGATVNGNVETRAYLEKKLVFCFGSYIASQLLLPFGEENILSSSDLKEAQEIATRMVIQYGWGPDDSPTIYHHGNAIYNLAYDKARMLLQKNYLALERIVEELLEYEILTGKHPFESSLDGNAAGIALLSTTN